jgi:hypothetical protein
VNPNNHTENQVIKKCVLVSTQLIVGRVPCHLKKICFVGEMTLIEGLTDNHHRDVGRHLPGNRSLLCDGRYLHPQVDQWTFRFVGLGCLHHRHSLETDDQVLLPEGGLHHHHLDPGDWMTLAQLIFLAVEENHIMYLRETFQDLIGTIIVLETILISYRYLYIIRTMLHVHNHRSRLAMRWFKNKEGQLDQMKVKR